MINIVTGVDTNRNIDLAHYKEAWKIGTLKLTNEPISGLIREKGVIVSPKEQSIQNLLSKHDRFRKYYDIQESGTVAFFEDMNTFYADSFMTYMKVVTVHKWIHSIDSLTTCPLKDIIAEDHAIYSTLWTWMFKHNIRFLRV